MNDEVRNTAVKKPTNNSNTLWDQFNDSGLIDRSGDLGEYPENKIHEKLVTRKDESFANMFFDTEDTVDPVKAAVNNEIITLNVLDDDERTSDCLIDPDKTTSLDTDVDGCEHSLTSVIRAKENAEFQEVFEITDSTGQIDTVEICTESPKDAVILNDEYSNEKLNYGGLTRMSPQSDEEGEIEEDEVPYDRVPDENEPNFKICIFNLPPSMKADKLRWHLESFGEVLSIETPHNKPVMVVFSTLESAVAAKTALNNKRIGNRTVQVVYASKDGSYLGQPTASKSSSSAAPLSRPRRFHFSDSPGALHSRKSRHTPCQLPSSYSHVFPFISIPPPPPPPCPPPPDSMILPHSSAAPSGDYSPPSPAKNKVVLRPNPMLENSENSREDNTSSQKASLTVDDNGGTAGQVDIIPGGSDKPGEMSALDGSSGRLFPIRQRIPLSGRFHMAVSKWAPDQTIIEQHDEYRELVKMFSYTNRYLLLTNLPENLITVEAVEAFIHQTMQETKRYDASDFEVQILPGYEDATWAHVSFKTKRDAADIYAALTTNVTPSSIVVEYTAPRKPNNCLWVGNLREFMCREPYVDQIRAMFEYFGEVMRFRMMPEKSCGFICYRDVQHAITARNHLYAVPLTDVFLNIDFSPAEFSFPTRPSVIKGGRPMNRSGSMAQFRRPGSRSPISYNGCIDHKACGLIPFDGLGNGYNTVSFGPPPCPVPMPPPCPPLQPLNRIDGLPPGNHFRNAPPPVSIYHAESFRSNTADKQQIPEKDSSDSRNKTDKEMRDTLLDLLQDPSKNQILTELLDMAKHLKSVKRRRKHSFSYRSDSDTPRSRTRSRSRSRSRSRKADLRKETNSLDMTPMRLQDISIDRPIEKCSHKARETKASQLYRRSSHSKLKDDRRSSQKKFERSRSADRRINKRLEPRRKSFEKTKRGREHVRDKQRHDPRSYRNVLKRMEIQKKWQSNRRSSSFNRKDAYISDSPPRTNQKTIGARGKKAYSDDHYSEENCRSPYVLAPDRPCSEKMSTNSGSYNDVVPAKPLMPKNSNEELMVVCEVYKQGRKCGMSAKYVKGVPSIRPWPKLEVNQRANLERLQAHLKQSTTHSLWQLGAETEADSTWYDNLCDYFIRKDRVGLLENETQTVYMVPPNPNYVEPLELPDPNFMYAFVFSSTF